MKINDITVFIVYIIAVFLSFSSSASNLDSSITNDAQSSKRVFKTVLKAEDEFLLRVSKPILKQRTSLEYIKISSFQFEIKTKDYNGVEERFKTDLTGFPSVNRICILEEITKMAIHKNISSTYFTIGNNHYKLYFSPTEQQKGNGVIVGLREYSENGNNGEKYSDILDTLRKVPSKNLRLFKKCLLEQKRDGNSIMTKNLGFTDSSKHQFYARYLDGFNLLLDFEEVRRRIDITDIHYQLPLLLGTYFLLNNLDNMEVLTKCLGGNGESYLFGGAKRNAFVSNVLSDYAETFQGCVLTDSISIQKFLRGTFSGWKPKSERIQPVQKSNSSSSESEPKVELKKKRSGSKQKRTNATSKSESEEVTSASDEVASSQEDSPESKNKKDKKVSNKTTKDKLYKKGSGSRQERASTTRDSESEDATSTSEDIASDQEDSSKSLKKTKPEKQKSKKRNNKGKGFKSEKKRSDTNLKKRGQRK